MALLSKVTVVVKPSPQLETPAPMTGDPLEVIERNDYIDPPEQHNDNLSVWFLTINPQKFLPPPEGDDSTPPPTVFRNNRYQQSLEPSVRRPARVYYPFSIARQNNSIVFASADTVNDVAMIPDGTTSIAPNPLNGQPNEITDFLEFDYQAGNPWWAEASSTVENQLNSEIVGYGDNKIAYSWVMCGNGYVLMSNGEIRKSKDGFTVDIEDVGVIPGNIQRIHPGILLAETQPYN